ncbi:MAG: cytochrome P450 [Myxococcota bacterium]
MPGPSSRILSTYRAYARPRTWLPRWFEQYGDPVRVPTASGNFVITGDPRIVRQLLSTNPDAFRPFTFPVTGSLFGERSITQLTGHEHRARRKLLMPPFHGQQMRGFEDAMQDIAHRALSRACLAGDARFRDIARSLTLEVILRTIFGVQSVEQTNTFKSAVGDLVDSMSPILLSLPILHRQLWGFGPFARYRRAVARLSDLLQEQIDSARHAAPTPDILCMLLGARLDDGTALSDAEIRQELVTLLFAGHESTSTALCWAVEAIGRDRTLRRLLRTEVRALGPEPPPSELAKLPLFDATIKEALRLHPPFPGIARVLAAPMELGGYWLEPGTVVAIDIPTVHHRDDVYPEPERFRPERFLERKYAPNEYLPFGGGHRRCIGAAFAGLEMRIVLGVLLGRFEFDLLRSQPPRAVRCNLTLAPAGGVPLTIHPRARGVHRDLRRDGME